MDVDEGKTHKVHKNNCISNKLRYNHQLNNTKGKTYSFKDGNFCAFRLSAQRTTENSKVIKHSLIFSRNAAILDSSTGAW